MKTILNILKWWSFSLVIIPYRLIKSNERYARYCGWFIIFSALQLILFNKFDFMIKFIVTELIMAYAIGLAIIVNKSTRTTKDKLIHIGLTICLCFIGYNSFIKGDEKIIKHEESKVELGNIDVSNLTKEECARMCDSMGLSSEEKTIYMAHYN